jgi:hypothetical protein
MTTLFKAKRSVTEAINAYQDPSKDSPTQALRPGPDEIEGCLRTYVGQRAYVAQNVSQPIDAVYRVEEALGEEKQSCEILLLGRPPVLPLFGNEILIIFMLIRQAELGRSSVRHYIFPLS